jgi:hypothetical protein
VTQFASLQIDLLNIKNNWMKNIVLRAALFMKYVLYFTLRAILLMFKFFPEKFVLTLCCCRQKVSRTARMLFEKSHADAAREGSKR